MAAIDLDSRVRADHPLRAIKRMADEDLTGMSRRFDAAYADAGRPSVPPERLIKSLLLQAIDSVRSEAQRVERMDHDPLFRPRGWFLAMRIDEDVFDATVLSHNRRRHAESIAARERMRRRTGSKGYRPSRRYRKKVEAWFGWAKTVAGLVRTNLIGHTDANQQTHLAAAAFNLIRMRSPA